AVFRGRRDLEDTSEERATALAMIDLLKEALSSLGINAIHNAHLARKQRVDGPHDGFIVMIWLDAGGAQSSGVEHRIHASLRCIFGELTEQVRRGDGAVAMVLVSMMHHNVEPTEVSICREESGLFESWRVR